MHGSKWYESVLKVRELHTRHVERFQSPDWVISWRPDDASLMKNPPRHTLTFHSIIFQLALAIAVFMHVVGRTLDIVR